MFSRQFGMIGEHLLRPAPLFADHSDSFSDRLANVPCHPSMLAISSAGNVIFRSLFQRGPTLRRLVLSLRLAFEALFGLLAITSSSMTCVEVLLRSPAIGRTTGLLLGFGEAAFACAVFWDASRVGANLRNKDSQLWRKDRCVHNVFSDKTHGDLALGPLPNNSARIDSEYNHASTAFTKEETT